MSHRSSLWYVYFQPPERCILIRKQFLIVCQINWLNELKYTCGFAEPIDISNGIQQNFMRNISPNLSHFHVVSNWYCNKSYRNWYLAFDHCGLTNVWESHLSQSRSHKDRIRDINFYSIIIVQNQYIYANVLNVDCQKTAIVTAWLHVNLCI